MSDLLNIMEWNRWSEEGKTVLEVLTILNNRHLEVVKTLARLRQDLQDPPADVQEAVLDKLNLRSVITQRDLLLEACVNLENDDGSIPASAWNMIQSAVAEAGGTPKEIPEATFREAYQQRCRMRDADALPFELSESFLETQELAIRLRNSLGLALEFFNHWDGVPMWVGLSEAQDALTKAQEALP